MKNKKLPILKENKARVATKTATYCLLILLIISAISNISSGHIPNPYAFIVVIIGFACLLISKISNIMKAKLISLGTGHMSENMSNLYRIGYWFMAVGMLLTFT